MNTSVLLSRDSKNFIWEVIPLTKKVSLVEVQRIENTAFPYRYRNHPLIKENLGEIVTVLCITSTTLRTRIWMGKKTFEKYFSHLS
ncbi:MAG: hypothetical protein EOM19_07890 [Candidatus Moranbacteria bacterium]|nr:hypothetical protein [Candidatus Moranbacteria bacterium]